MTDDSYQKYHITLIEQLAETIRRSTPFCEPDLDEPCLNFLSQLERVCDNDTPSEERRSSGQWLLTQIVANYPHLTPYVPRGLFWYFGGDCMHFLEDDEIRHFQMLEEQYYEQAQSNDFDAIVNANQQPPNKSLN